MKKNTRIMSIKLSFFLCITALIVKIIAIYYTNFDLFGDEAQYWAWSKDLDLGYYSKPPLLAWLIGFVTFFLGNSFETLKFIPFFMYILNSYIVFLITKKIYKNKNRAILTAISFYLLPAATVSSFLISTDILLIFFWSLSLLFLLKIRDHPTIMNFLLLGIFLGLAFLTKYAAIYFVLSFLVILYFDAKLKKIFFTKIIGISVFISSGILVFLPNIVWNTKNNWATFNHTSDNASLDKININLFQGLEFIFIQAIMVGPFLFLFFIFSFNKLKISFESKFLLSFSLPVLFIVFIESVLVRANANWAAVALVPLMILFFNHISLISKNFVIINNMVNFVFCLVFFILIINTSSLKVFNRINGISNFSSHLEKTHMQSNKYLVVQDRLLYSNLQYLFKDLNKILLTPHNPKNRITSHFHLVSPLLPSFKENFIYLGSPNELKYLTNEYQIKKIETKTVKFTKESIGVYEIIF